MDPGVITRCDKRKRMSGNTWSATSVHNQGILWLEPKIFVNQVYTSIYAYVGPCVECNGNGLYQDELFHTIACVNGSAHCLRHETWSVCREYVDTKPIITANNQVYRTTVTKFRSRRATVRPGCDYDVSLWQVALLPLCMPWQQAQTMVLSKTHPVKSLRDYICTNSANTGHTV